MDPAIDLTVRAVLALLFLGAASHKVGDLARFRASVAAYRVLPPVLVSPTALLLVGAELTVAGALALPFTRAAGLAGAAALLVVYAAAVGVNLARGRWDLDCGCTGPAARRPISGWLVGRNAILAAFAIAGLAPVRPRPLGWVDAVTVVAAVATLAALHLAVDHLLAHEPAIARLRGAA